MMFFTGFTRSAETIEQRKIAKFKDRGTELRAMYDMVNEGERILMDPSRPLAQFGDLLHQGWMEKRKLDESVSNPTIDASYEAGRKAGALGGKLLGAGGGGFLLMFAPPERQAAVREAMKDLIHVPFRMERDGTSVVLYNPELTANYLTAKSRVS